LKATLRAGEVETAKRLMEEHCPSARAEDPRNWDAAAVSPQSIATLSADHGIERAAAIELCSAFSEAKDRRVPGFKRHDAAARIDGERLNLFSVLRRDVEGDGIQRNANRETSACDLFRRRLLAQLQNRINPKIMNQRAIVGDVSQLAVADGKYGEAKGVRADRSQLNFAILRLSGSGLRLFVRQQANSRRGGKALQDLSAVPRSIHVSPFCVVQCESRATRAPLPPTRKSMSAPRCACST
jgi:hypothetical protein